jgi:hypothetical protein
MSTSRAAKFTATKVVERVPCRAGSACSPGAWSTVKSGFMVASSSGAGAEEHVVGKEVVPRASGHHPDVDPGLRILSGPGIPDEELPLVQVGHHVGPEGVEVLLGEGHVHLPPVHVAPPPRAPGR